MRIYGLVGLLLVGIMAWHNEVLATAQPITQEFKLDNGLKIVIREDHRAPLATVQVWYKVGSADEVRGVTGISHALEHMMFKGTEQLPGDSFTQHLTKEGGRVNAFTSEDTTAYHALVDTSKIEKLLAMEADRMRFLLIEEPAFQTEIEVVMEERRLRTDDNPTSFTFERFMAVANPIGPYHHPVVGWQEDLTHMTAADLRSWYQKWYAPNNAVLIVVGDVVPNDILVMVKKYFDSMPAKPIRPTQTVQELTPLGESRMKVHVPAKVPAGFWGFRVPSLPSASDPKEAYALHVLSALLAQGDSARLQRELVRGSQKAASIQVHYDPLQRYETQFLFVAVPSNNHTVGALEEAIMQVIAKLQEMLVDALELEKVKTQLVSQEIFEKDSVEEQARFLGALETSGLSWELSEKWIENLRAVTAEEVQQVARKYFQSRRLTHAELVPENSFSSF